METQKSNEISPYKLDSMGNGHVALVSTKFIFQMRQHVNVKDGYANERQRQPPGNVNAFQEMTRSLGTN